MTGYFSDLSIDKGDKNENKAVVGEAAVFILSKRQGILYFAGITETLFLSVLRQNYEVVLLGLIFSW
jgi:hypothetical protein